MPVVPAAHLAVVHYFARRYDEAARALSDTLELDPNFGPALIMLGRVYDAKGMPERAVEQLERAQRIMGVRPGVLTPHAYVLGKAGRRAEALERVDV